MKIEPDVLVQALMLGAVWIWALWGPMMRSARTVGLLLIATVTFGLPLVVPQPAAVIARTVIVLGTVFVLLARSRWFEALTDPERRFDEEYSRVMRALHHQAERSRAGELSHLEFVAELARLEAQLRAMSAPAERWAALRERCADFLQAQRTWYERAMSGLPVSDSELDEARSAGAALIDEHRRVRLQARSFWGR